MAGKAGSLTKIKQKMLLRLTPSVITDVLISGWKGISHTEPLDGTAETSMRAEVCLKGIREFIEGT